MRVIKSIYDEHDIEKMTESWISERQVFVEKSFNFFDYAKSHILEFVTIFLATILIILLFCKYKIEEPLVREYWNTITDILMIVVLICDIFQTIKLCKLLKNRKERLRSIYVGLQYDENNSHLHTLLLCYENYKQLCSLPDEILSNAKLGIRESEETITVILEDNETLNKQEYRIWLPKHLNLVYAQKGILDFSVLDKEYGILLANTKREQ